MTQQYISDYFSKNPNNKDNMEAGPSIIGIDDDEMANFDSEHEELEDDVLPVRDSDEFYEVICFLV